MQTNKKKSPTKPQPSWVVSLLQTPGQRRGLLVGAIALGMVASAWTLSQWPTRYEATASFTMRDRAAELSNWNSPDFKRRVLGELGPFAQNHFADAWDTINYSESQSDHNSTLSITAEGAEPALAQRLALAVAESIRQQSLPERTVSDVEIAEAKRSYELAEQRLRRALAELGEMDQASVDPFIKRTKGESSSAGESLPTTPALASSSRQSAGDETLVEQTIATLSARRDRFVRLYTIEHPAVIALERQIAHLRSQATSGAVAAKSDGQVEAEADIQLASANELTASVEFLQDERDQARGLWESLLARAESANADIPASAQLTGIRYVGLDRRFAFISVLLSLVTAAGLMECLALKRWKTQPSSAD